MSKHSKDLFDKRYRYSIRRFSVGAASVVIGCLLFGTNVQQVHANTAELETTSRSAEEGVGQAESDQATESQPTETNPVNGEELSETPVAEVVASDQDQEHTAVSVSLVQIDQANSTATSQNGQDTVNKAFDSNPATYWQSAENNPNQVNTEANPQYLVAKLTEPGLISWVEYTPRQYVANDVTGNIKKLKLFVSSDNQNWEPIIPVSVENDAGTVGEDHSVTITHGTQTSLINITPVLGQYVRLQALTTEHWQEANRNKMVTAAEFRPVALKVEKSSESAQVSVVRIVIDKENSSATSQNGQDVVGKAFDSNPNTYWQSNEANASDYNTASNPQYLVAKLAESGLISWIEYTPRQHPNEQVTGNVRRLRLEVSSDNQTWTPIVPVSVDNGYGTVEADHSVSLVHGTQTKVIHIQPIEGQYVRLQAIESEHWNTANRNKMVTAGEFRPVAFKVTVTEATVEQPVEAPVASQPSNEETPVSNQPTAENTEETGNQPTAEPTSEATGLEALIAEVELAVETAGNDEIVELALQYITAAQAAQDGGDEAALTVAEQQLRELLELINSGELTSESSEAAPDNTEAPAQAQPESSADIAVAENQDIVIENNFIKQSLKVENGRLRTEFLENKINNNERLTFAAESKEFNITFAAPALPEYIALSDDRDSWTVTTNSHAKAATATDEGPAKLALDGKLDTIWHSNYNGSGGTGPTNAFPYQVDLGFAEAKTVKSFVYVPRQNGTNGDVSGYKLYYKTEENGSYQLAKEGSFATFTSKTPQIIELETAIQAKAIRFEAISSQNGQRFASAAEFDVSDKTAAEITSHWAGIRAKHQELLTRHEAQAQVSTANLTVKVNGITRSTADGVQKTIVEFNNFTYQGTEYQVRYVIELHNDAHFLQKYLELKPVDGQEAHHPIASIDLQSYKLQGEEKVWKLPPQANIAEMAGYNSFYAGLGQPVYLKSFYTGANFPLAWNSISDDNVVFSRYYSGKSLDQQAKSEDGYYRTWNTIIGVARSDDYQVLQQDFYKYIEKVGQKTYYRTQYNSWFDHMLNINAKNIQESFNEIERGFTNGGVAPLHSFVVDDGWQDMATLWDFNQKFPNKLYDSSKQAQRFGSNFGLWVGPQGGYSQPGTLADNLVRQNLASKHGGVVYIGDNRYVEGMRGVFTGYEEKFDINYWKLDGLLLSPRSDTDPENYIGGGFRNMYSMTEAHERWISLYESIREHATDPDQMWINLTSYIPPSPWFLQWVNSIWMQNAADVDYQDHTKRGEYANLDFGNDANEAITYRDDRYEEVVNLRKWQLPFANIYNHDPVYGNTAHTAKRESPNGAFRQPIRFSTDDLRTYLYMLGTRGTGFWEFYYSYNMMDEEKWQVNGEAVNWIESNFETLKNARFHGGKPGHGQVYGYSAWDEEKGILSIRNPIPTTQTYRVTLDRLVGVLEGTSNMHRKIVLGDSRHNSTELMNYGQEFEITLNGYETVIFEFSKTADTESAKVYKANVDAQNTVRVQFDERVFIDNASFQVNGQAVEAQLQADYRTVLLTLPSNLSDRESVTVSYTGVKDAAATANISTGQIQLRAYDGGRVLNSSSPSLGTSIENDGIKGRGEFSVTVKANLNRLNQVLASQEDNWTLSVDETGRAVFNVKGLEVKSAPFVTLKEDDKGRPDQLVETGKDVTITAVRQTNGSLRIYVNGVLHATAYDKAKINEELDYAAVRIGTEGFDGTIHRMILENKARDFETAVAIATELTPVPFDRDLRSALTNKTATSHDAGENAVAGSATDGSLSTYWASNPSNPNTRTPQYLELTFDQAQTVDKVTYYGRQVANAVGNAKKAYLEYTSDGTSWQRLALTNGNEDNTKNLDAAVLTGQEITFAPTSMKALRFYASETAHWNTGSVNTVVAVAELVPSIMTVPTAEVPLDFTYLKNVLASGAALSAENYTPASFAPLSEILGQKSELLALDSQEEIDQATAEIRGILSELEAASQDTGGTTDAPGTGGATETPGSSESTDAPDTGGATEVPNPGEKPVALNTSALAALLAQTEALENLTEKQTQELEGLIEAADAALGGTDQAAVDEVASLIEDWLTSLNTSGTSATPETGGTTDAPSTGGTTETPNTGGTTETPGSSESTDAPGTGGATEAPDTGNTGETPTPSEETEAPNSGLLTEEVVLVDPATGIRVRLEAGESDQIVKVAVTELPESAERDTDFYDIVLLDQAGKEVAPSKDTLVVLPIKAGKEVEAVQYHKEDGSVESLAFTETLVQNEDGTSFPAVVFVAKHFSIYGVVYVETAKGPGLVNEGPAAFEGGLVPNQAPKQVALPAASLPTSQKESSKSDAKTLPNTGSQEQMAMTVLGTVGLLAGLGLASRRRQKK
ncbi:discoidin domain-containing protein [Streptococcus suis]|uniref:YSIRK-type signal peptide-containing protein n=2 Tax=Streptococcus suis TaxID=1307 RepID=A0A4T2GPB4_STRSU|nr:discoidin domain-containing protein [Streptococcus suis]TII01049.1 YSIRK-type signal peptide-containing protein [Streptococcus suis]